MRDIAEAGVGVGLGIGYRALPSLSIAATGQFQGFNASNELPQGTQVRGGTAGIEATFHIAPFERADPWLSLGSGYRMLWEVPSGRRALDAHARVRGRAAGHRRRPQALGERRHLPEIGADLDVFAWRSQPGTEMTAVSEPTVSTFVVRRPPRSLRPRRGARRQAPAGDGHLSGALCSVM